MARRVTIEEFLLTWAMLSVRRRAEEISLKFNNHGIKCSNTPSEEITPFLATHPSEGA